MTKITPTNDHYNIFPVKSYKKTLYTYTIYILRREKRKNSVDLFSSLSWLLLFCEGLDRVCFLLNGAGSSTKDYKIHFCI